jgi:hypothetical protein
VNGLFLAFLMAFEGRTLGAATRKLPGTDAAQDAHEEECEDLNV